MATFPALVPASRTFTAATYPGAAQLAYSGRESRVRTSNAQTGARFRLAFSALTEAQMLAIRDHYYGQLGRFIPFQLSTELLSGMANPSAVTPTGYQWIYVSSPRVTDLPTGTAAARSCRHDVELELELVPEVSALVSGAGWVVMATMDGGAADSGNINLPGATWSAAAAIAGGEAIYGGSASGATWSAAAAIAGGAANGDNVNQLGASWSAAAVIAGGAADDGTGDPYFSSVSLLLHMNGSNGSTTFTDSSNNGLTVTASGNAQITTTGAKYGGACAIFDGSNDYLSAPTGSGFQFGTGDLTVETWINIDSAPGSGKYYAVFDNVPIGGGSTRANAFVLLITDARKLVIFQNGSFLSESTNAVPTGQWSHIALTRSGSTWRYFIDGALDATTLTNNANLSTGGCLVGVINESPENTSYTFAGKMDDLRITKACRYTSTFTPPTAAFPNS